MRGQPTHALSTRAEGTSCYADDEHLRSAALKGAELDSKP